MFKAGVACDRRRRSIVDATRLLEVLKHTVTDVHTSNQSAMQNSRLFPWRAALRSH
jgi:hypothetical protein